MAIYHVRLNQVFNGFPQSTGLYYEVDDPSEADLDGLTIVLRNIWADRVTHLATTWSLQNVQTRLIDGTGIPYVTRDSTVVTGTSAGNPTSNKAFISVFFQSGTGRPNRSWIQFFGFTEANISGGQIDAALLVGLNALAADVREVSLVSGKDFFHVVATVQGNPQNVVAYNRIASHVVNQRTSFNHGRA